MLWFVLSLITAISFAARAVISKKILKDTDEYIVAWARSFFSLPFLLLLLFFTEIPEIDITFWMYLGIGTVFVTIASILHMKALKVSPLSLTIPFMNFTPLFLLITSPLMLGEKPSIFGGIGILLIVFGAYVLNIQTFQKGFFEPFKAIAREKGSLFMLIVAFLFAISSNIDKIAVLKSSAIFYAIIFQVGLSIVLFPFVALKSKNRIMQLKNNLFGFFMIGFLLALIVISHMTAITLTIVPYVISIKRTAAIFSVIFGYLFFKEKNFKQCLVGATIMVIGVLLITLF